MQDALKNQNFSGGHLQISASYFPYLSGRSSTRLTLSSRCSW